MRVTIFCISPIKDIIYDFDPMWLLLNNEWQYSVPNVPNYQQLIVFSIML